MPRSEREQMRKAKIAEFKANGISGRKWCAEHDLKPRQLCYWLAKLREADAQPQGQARRRETEIGQNEMPVEALEIRVGRATAEVRPGFDPEFLMSVVRVLAWCQTRVA